MIRYEDLAEKFSRFHPDASTELIQRGYVASAKYHKGQLRMNGEPYLTHPLEVANILAELNWMSSPLRQAFCTTYWKTP